MSTPPEPDPRARLAPLYGEEPPPLAPRDAAELEAVRDLVVDYMAAPPPQGRLREAVLARVSRWPAKAALVTPLGGPVLLRRAGAHHPLPHERPVEGDSDDLLLVPTGSRAEVRLPDGTSLLLASGTTLRIGSSDEGRERVRLLAGRVFAWVERQALGRFIMGTPQGAVTVLGTRFDVSTDPREGLRVLVTHGLVAFAPGSAAAPPVATLRRGQLLTLEASGAPRVRTLPRREVEEQVRWACGVGAPPIPSVARRALLLTLAAGTALGALLLAAPPIARMGAVIPFIEPRVEGRPFVLQPIPPEGLRLRILADVRIEEQGGVPARYRSTIISERTAADEAGWRTVSRRMEAREALRADGSVIDPDAPTPSAFRYRSNGDTLIAGIDPGNGAAPDAADLNRALEFLLNDLVLMHAPGLVQPGQRWSLERGGTFAPDPSIDWRLEVGYRHAGREFLDGREVARIDFNAMARIRGGVVAIQREQDVTREYHRLESRLRQRGFLLVDPETSALLRVEEQGEASEQLELRTRVGSEAAGAQPFRRSRRTQSVLLIEPAEPPHAAPR